MPYNYEETHQNILHSAKENFLTYGYKNANLRTICHQANVTTGAFYRHFKNKEDVFYTLIAPLLKALGQNYEIAVMAHEDLVGQNVSATVWTQTEKALIQAIHIIYAHYEAAKLLIQHAEGTPYAKFLDDFIDAEAKTTLLYLDALKDKGYLIKPFQKKDLVLLIHAEMYALIEIILNDYSLDEALSYGKTVASFFNAGWETLLGLSSCE